MKDRIPLLAGLLAAQILLLGVVSFGGGDQQATDTLLTLDPERVTGFEITDADGARISLKKQDGRWLLEDGNPADQDKVTGVLEDLTGMVAAWPVATSGDSQTRFEVTADKFQRQLVFKDGEAELARIYLGTSPGYQRVHARRDGDDSVFSINFANHEVPTSVDDWLDKALFGTSEVTSVTLADGALLEQADDGWRLDGSAADQKAVDDLVGRIERLRVIGYQDAAEKASSSAAPRRIEVRSADGSYQLSFSHDDDNDDYRLESDRYPGEFAVASYVAEQILVDAASLEPAAEGPATESAAAPGAVTEPGAGAASAQPGLDDA